PFAPRATGNIATEDLLYLLHRSGVATGMDLDSAIETARWFEGVRGTPAASMLARAGSFPARRWCVRSAASGAGARMALSGKHNHPACRAFLLVKDTPLMTGTTPGTASGTPAAKSAWSIIRRFAPYLWPKNAPDLKLRIIIAAILM